MNALLNTLKAMYSLVCVLLCIFIGFLIILLVFPRLSQDKREACVQAWSAKMLQCIGITLIVRGVVVVPGPLLLVANHISWLDITSLHAARFCHFVSKADIRQWPIIGTLATGVGTLFIERPSRRDAMRVVQAMTQRLSEGGVIGVFPEGTTSDGIDLLPFHANLLQAAIDAVSPVQPVAIQFIDRTTGQRHAAPCYITGDTLLSSVWRTLRASGIAVVVTFGTPQESNGRNRREWARALRDDIAALRGA